METVQEIPSKSLFKRFWNGFGSLDTFIKLYLITMLLILIAIPIISTQQSNFFSRATQTNLLQNGSFEDYGSGNFTGWNFIVQKNKYGSISQDTTQKTDGNSSAKINISVSRPFSPNAVRLQQTGIILGTESYTLSFWTKADKSRNIQVSVEKSVSPYTNYFLQSIPVSTAWTQNTFTFTMSDPDTNAALRFNLAATSGTVWLDNVVLTENSPPTSVPVSPTIPATPTPATTTASYNLIVSMIGQGSVTPAPGTYSVAQGQTVTMTAVPAAGWTFRSWSWPSNVASYNGWPDNPTSWNMTEPISIVAIFDPAGTSPTPAATVTLTPIPTVTPTPIPPTPLPSSGTHRVVGFIGSFGPVNSGVDLSKVTHAILEYISVTSASNMTLQYFNSTSQISPTVNQIRAANPNIKILISLYNLWTTTANNAIFADANLRSQLINNLVSVVNTYKLDGISLDWESDESQSTYSAANFSTFIAELYNALPAGRKIIEDSTSYRYVTLTTGAAQYIDAIDLMTYDTVDPWYADFPTMQGALNLWANAGFPKNKLDAGISFAGRAPADSWRDYATIYNTYTPASSANQAGSGSYLYTFNGQDLVAQKTQWITSNGFGGVMVYHLNLDLPTANSHSLLKTIFNNI